MLALPGFRIDWSTAVGELCALEPRLDEVAAHVTALAAAYNAPLLGDEATISESEVLDHYESLFDQGAHPFLLYREDELAGDGDVREVGDGAAEFAFLIAEQDPEIEGLGTMFATMIHVFAFAHLPIDRIHVSLAPGSVSSRQVFEELGYVADAGEVTMSIDRATFERMHAQAMAEIHIAMR